MAVTDPRSRNEEILRATIDGTEYDAPPQSRIEDLLIQLKEAIEHGGGGGGGDVTGVKGSAESTYRKGNVNLTAENIGVEAGAEVNAIASISLNGDPITPDANKNVALVVITNTVNNLVNYYLKTETYSKSEVDAIAALLKNGHFIYVNELPTTDIDQTAIYLVPKSSAQTNNVKDEYINLDGTSAGWEKIGDTQIDLSDYVTTTQLTTALSDYTTTTALTALLADKVDKVSGKGLSTNDYDNTEKQKVADAQPKTLSTPIEVEGVQQTTVEGALGAINNKSGTGSIDHYSQLPDKPQINSVELEGNKSLSDLGIQPAESGKGLSTNDYDNTAKGIVDGVTAALADKVDKVSGKGLSTNDYTSADKAKLESLTRVQYDVMPTASGARVGMVVMYIGATNANYTHNYVYECVDNGGSYAWERKDVQPNEGGGHTIENASGTALTQRDTLQFKGGLSVSDDSTNEVTVVDDTVPEIEWSVWNAMTPQEQEAIPNALILNAPDSGGGSSEDVQAIVNVYGSKNLLTYPYYDTTKTDSGVTFTDNGDGTVTVSGTSTGEYFSLFRIKFNDNSYVLKKGTYKFSSGLSSGSLSTYYIQIFYKPVNSQSSETGFQIFNEDVDVTFPEDIYFTQITLIIITGQTVNNLIFKPMIRDARISDDTWVPYAMTNKDLTDQKANKSDIVELQLTGTTNTSGGTITAGTWFYLNSKLVKAKVDIASNATFTKDTNYEEKTIGEELSELNGNSFNNVSQLWEVDANTITTGGTYYCNLASNYPDGTSSLHTIGWMQVMTIINGEYLVQVFWNRAQQMWYRTKEAGVWNSWHKVTTS